ncbi:hypothetical protein A7976_13535 [Methylobacillus sp. MM3]|uniref:DNA-primase RepB domain-containing protein n=1 Tax=Methylobacillus sp. MM3 TaxID=1848039 RepID=UPI0007E00139|nr:DNA-primase RepB domain-containing protein [Methylobacillus sp. MM3]OAJ69651.1 hypothetical protein A7976_13535 [Methylobacillus sp. MM3]
MSEKKLSGQQLSWAIRDYRSEDLTRTEKSVLQNIALRMQSSDSEPFPSIPTIAADAIIHPRTAQRLIKTLEEKGYLKVTRRWNEGRKTNDSNRYRIVWPPQKPTPPLVASCHPPGGMVPPTPGGMVPPEVEKLLKLKTEDEKSLLTTAGRSEGQTKHPATVLSEWLKSAGAEAIEVASLSRDESQQRASFRSITPGDARSENDAHCCIFIRPARGDAQPCIMLDDLDATAAADVASRWRSAIVETSAGNHQVWVAAARPMSEDERKRVQRIVGAGYGADKGSSSGDHYGRAPGFVNRKPERAGFEARLIQAAERGKLLDVDAVLRQEPAAPATRYRQSASAVLTFPRRPANRIYAGGDASESGREFGWVMGAIENGMSPSEVEARLADQAEARRGKDAARYATRTVRAALKKVGARA